MCGIRARNPESLANLYDETSRFLYGLALHILRDAADAEEVTMDVYQYLWNHSAVYDESRGSLWSWLAVVTRNRAIDRLRQSSGRRAREVPIQLEHDPAEANAVPENLTLFQEERRLVRDAMDTLTCEQRQAIELAFFSGLTHVEVAEHLGAPLGTIKTRIRVGLQRLKQAMPPAMWIGARADAE
jgi:RNA polymerase sigma-70 factor, ECF subfamily